MSIGYAGAPIDPATARMMAARRPRALELTPVGLPALRELIERFITVGFSKFVVRHSQSARRAVALPRSPPLSLSLLMLTRKKRSGYESSVQENDVN